MTYADELSMKSRQLTERFGREVRVRPSPSRHGYRSRMDFVCAMDRIGLRQRGASTQVVELEVCHLLPVRAWEAVRRAREAVRRAGLTFYSYRRHEGRLRYVSVRAAPVDGGVMLILLTHGREPSIAPLLDELAGAADSVVWASTDRRADINLGDIVDVRGSGWIEERIAELRLRFGPNSFFQANTPLAGELAQFVADRCEGRTTDLFCGVGLMALAAARRAEHVVGIELVEEAIRFADVNARLNGVGNARFFVGDARRFIEEHRCDVLVLDPPRAGLGPKFVRKVVRAAPPRIVYVSCNPSALAAELPGFDGYRLTELEGFDLFPMTPHVEAVAVLQR